MRNKNLQNNNVGFDYVLGDIMRATFFKFCQYLQYCMCIIDL